MTTAENIHQLLEPSDEVFYIESSLPARMTVGEYRRSRPSRPTRWQRVRQLVGG